MPCEYILTNTKLYRVYIYICTLERAGAEVVECACVVGLPIFKVYIRRRFFHLPIAYGLLRKDVLES